MSINLLWAFGRNLCIQ